MRPWRLALSCRARVASGWLAGTCCRSARRCRSCSICSLIYDSDGYILAVAFPLVAYAMLALAELAALTLSGTRRVPLLAASLLLLPGGLAARGRARLRWATRRTTGSSETRVEAIAGNFDPGDGARHVARVLAVELPSRDVLPAGVHHACSCSRIDSFADAGSRDAVSDGERPHDPLLRARTASTSVLWGPRWSRCFTSSRTTWSAS